MAETKSKTTNPVSKKVPSEKKVPSPKKSTLSVSVYDINGKVTKTVPLEKNLFAEKDNKELIAQYVRVYLHNQSQGTSQAKTRGEVIGSTRKIYRQKGGGRARHGSRKAQLFRGGGVTFGPLSGKTLKTLSKKQKRKALAVSLSNQQRLGSIKVLEEGIVSIKPSTKTVQKLFSELKLDKKVLVVLDKVEANGLVLSSRNIPNVSIVQSTTINPYIILNNQTILFTEKGLETLQKHFTTNP